MVKTLFTVLLAAAAGQLASATFFNSCVGGDGPTFSRDEAIAYIDYFCSEFPNNGQPYVGLSLSDTPRGSDVQFKFDIEGATDLSAYPGASCTWSGNAQFDVNTCEAMLTAAIDNCDTDTTAAKHGNAMLDDTNCLIWTLAGLAATEDGDN